MGARVGVLLSHTTQPSGSVDALASSASQLDSGVGGGDDVSPVSELDCLEAARFVCTDFPRKQATRAYTLAERVATAQDPSARVTHVSFCAALRTTLLLRELLDELKRSVWKDTSALVRPLFSRCVRAREHDLVARTHPSPYPFSSPAPAPNYVPTGTRRHSSAHTLARARTS